MLSWDVIKLVREISTPLVPTIRIQIRKRERRGRMCKDDKMSEGQVTILRECLWEKVWSLTIKYFAIGSSVALCRICGILDIELSKEGR